MGVVQAWGVVVDGDGVDVFVSGIFLSVGVIDGWDGEVDEFLLDGGRFGVVEDAVGDGFEPGGA